MANIDTKEYIKNHISRVHKNLLTFISLLQLRAENHDKSKLEEPEITWWKQMDEEPRYSYGSAEYIDKIRRWKKVFDHHYKCNRHHPEHFQNGVNDMNFVDMIEMLCDWVGYKNVMSIKEAINVVDMQMDRYGFSNDLRDIMKNTLIDYFSVLGGFDKNQSNYNNTPIGLIEELGINNERVKDRKEGDYQHFIDIYV